MTKLVAHHIQHRHSSLLCGTALASTVLIGALAPSPVLAQQAVNLPAQVAPVNITNNTNCTFAGDCILITTTGGTANTINLINNGTLTSTGAMGIDTQTQGASITIRNNSTGVITSADDGIFAVLD